MGLDMYLEKQSKSPNGWKDGTMPKIEVGYWRKANAIHNWFVVNVAGGEDDCLSYPVSQDQLECLRNLCHRLLIKKSENAAKRELQPKEGFFFGSTDIDEGYWQDLETTVKTIDALDFNEDVNYYYQASW